MGRLPPVEKEILSEEKEKLVLDEQTLGKLLHAAYVLQEHNREVRDLEGADLPNREQIEEEERSVSTSSLAAPQTQETESTPTDFTFTLAKIVETQHQIQVRHLELDSAMSLVAKRLTQIARASGAAIGILDGKKFRYRVAAGILTLPAGTEVPMEKALCGNCLRTGQVFRCADVKSEALVDAEECRRRGILALIAVPVFHDGDVAGCLELYYPSAQAFTEQDVHTCRLMAGLVTEALARADEATWKKSLASERAVMLEALEKLKPNLAALIQKPETNDSGARTAPPATAEPSFTCRRCGHKLVGEEQFCGNCGTPRSSDYEAPSMQSKLASLWRMQESLKKPPSAEITEGRPAHDESQDDFDGADIEKSLADSLQEQMPELFESAEVPVDKTIESTDLSSAPISAEFEDSILSDLEIPAKIESTDEVEAPQTTALAKSDRATAWSSAASAREFLEQLAVDNRPGTLALFWQSRRGDVYLAVAVLLVAAVIRWGILSNPSVSATAPPTPGAAAHRKPAPDAGLSAFDRMLISLGLAEAPPAPENKGNPDTPVWVDLHTALYYCPGADLYGKTPKGKFASQRDAQLDQFEPANRKACD
jgi:ribosomal protein L37E